MGIRSAIEVIAAAGAVGVLAGCGGGSLTRGAPAHFDHAASAVVGGSVDDAHPAVVLVYDSSNGALCSGTVIAARVVLTSGRCLSADGDPAHYEVGGGVAPLTNADWIAGVVALHLHPEYDPATPLHDVAVLILAADAPVTPMPWLATGGDEVYGAGRFFTAVGYGMTSGDGSDQGTRRKADMQIEQSDPASFWYGGPGMNACTGDTGGPGIATVDDVETVIGSVSYSDSSCTEFGADMRTDDNAEFLAAYAPAPQPSPTGTPSDPGDPNDNDGRVGALSTPGGVGGGCDIGPMAAIDGRVARGAVAGALAMLGLLLAGLAVRGRERDGVRGER